MTREFLGGRPVEKVVEDNTAIRALQYAAAKNGEDTPHSISITEKAPMRLKNGNAENKVDVIGAGMAGLLAAAMLRKDCHGVFEAAPQLPNNHSAVLRFRSSVVADTLNLPFKRVKAIKAVEPWRNPIADAMAYSRKTNGSATMRSVLTAGGEPAERFIAPGNLVARMAAMVDAPIHFGEEYPFWGFEDRPVISTIPMPALMEALLYPRRDQVYFHHRDGKNIIAQLHDVDAYCSLYVPDPQFPAARISITGNELVAECYGGWTTEDPYGFALECARRMGLHETNVIPETVRMKRQRYAKILPIDEGERRRFIMWASEHHGIFSLGRFATWRPGLLLDDVVNDVRVIQRLISNSGESYPHKMKG